MENVGLVDTNHCDFDMRLVVDVLFLLYKMRNGLIKFILNNAAVEWPLNAFLFFFISNITTTPSIK